MKENIIDQLMEEGRKFLPSDVKELKALLGNKSLRRALGKILLDSKDLDSLQGLDLTRQEGLNEALKRQGQVNGIMRTVEDLFDLGEENVSEIPE